MATSYESLTQRVTKLAHRVEGLEAENAQLRASQPSERSAPAVRRFDRRNLLRLGGAAAAVGAGAVMLRPDAAGAVVASVDLGVDNDGGSAGTGIASSNATDTLHVTNSSTGSGTSGSSITAHNTDAANEAAALHVIHDGFGDAIVGEVGTPDSGAGVVGLGIDHGGVIGATGGGGAAVVGVVGTGATGPAMFAWCFDANGSSTAIEAQHDGKGHGVYSHIENAANNHRAIYGSTKGTGAGVLGTVTNALSKAPALQGVTTGLGAGVDVTSAKGAGGRFTGKTAQIQLVPSAAATHPTVGGAGQLFVDHSNRLWFCKGGTTWKLLA